MADLSAIEGLRNQIKGLFRLTLDCMPNLLTLYAIDNMFYIVLKNYDRYCSDIRITVYTLGAHWGAEALAIHRDADTDGDSVDNARIASSYRSNMGANNEVEALHHLLRHISQYIHRYQ